MQYVASEDFEPEPQPSGAFRSPLSEPAPQAVQTRAYPAAAGASRAFGAASSQGRVKPAPTPLRPIIQPLVPQQAVRRQPQPLVQPQPQPMPQQEPEYYYPEEIEIEAQAEDFTELAVSKPSRASLIASHAGKTSKKILANNRLVVGVAGAIVVIGISLTMIGVARQPEGANATASQPTGATEVKKMSADEAIQKMKSDFAAAEASLSDVQGDLSE